MYGSYAEALQEIREKDATIRQNFADRYGIDMKELFEEYYADDKKQNPTPETPKKPSEPDTSGDDLLS